MTPHPWRMLRELPEITLTWHESGPAGEFFHEAMTLSIRHGLTQAQRRSVVRHELEHYARGPVWEAWREREELACEVASARYLIDIRKLGEAMAWAHGIEEVADELWVDEDLVRVRLDHLHPAERAYLRERLEHLG